MENSFFHRLSSALWGVIVILVVLLAIYVSVGRMLAANLGAYQTEILQELNSRVPFTIEAQQVSGEWRSFTPVIVLTGLRMNFNDSPQAPLEMSEGRIGVDVLNSLRTRSLRLTRLALDDLRLRGELTSQGGLRLTGFEGAGGQVGDWIRDLLLNVELVALRNNSLILTLPSGEKRNLDVSVLLTRDGSHRRIEANLVSTGGTDISVLAEGVGNPFTPRLFAGELYLDIQSSDLGAVKDMLANGPPGFWADDGTLDLQLWLAWDKGRPSVEVRGEARELLLAGEDQSWQVPLDRVALEAHLVERKNHWALFASDLEVQRGDVTLQLPRLQMDAWGDALRLRAIDVPLAPISTIVANLEATPAAVVDVVRVLQPRGDLTSLQLSIGDIDKPATDWEVEANFEEVSVDSWKGAPGVTSASGYAQIAQGGGFVILDSQQLTMDFPTVYHEPLRYDDFHGTIDINWDQEAINLSSGRVTARGEEGKAQVLFGLNIPRTESDTGLQMDLLVGLENAHPTHRGKYLPYVLNESLHNWLSDSIGEGIIEQGAFLWRGSLKRKAPLRTIQLAFNIADTGLNYHPEWPPVTVLDGIILIDDSNVSVWADHASLFDSSVQHLSVETWLNESSQIMLAVNGSLQGPADDGLTVLNKSPLAKIVGGAFSDWKLTGDLHTDLKLKMNLTDQSAPPGVDVATRLRNVSLDIVPGNLPVRELKGEFNYSTSDGFTSRNLAGKLWGKDLNANLVQRHNVVEDGYDAGSSELEVVLDATADMADVRQWLNLDFLAFAQGQTPVDVKVLIAPGKPPLLNIDSALVGVSLDLPTPWRKLAADERQLHLELPLSGDENLLAITLGAELELKLDVMNGGLRAGVLTVNEEPGELQAGVFRISGHAPLMQADEWIRFVTDYFASDAAQSGEDVVRREEVAVQLTSPATGVIDDTEDAQDPELLIIIDHLRADDLVIWEQQVPDMTFSLAIEQALWRLSFETEWLRGNLLLAQDDTVSRLDIQHFDLSGMPELNLVLDDEQQVLELPDIDVTLDGLYQADRLLGNLAFDLRSQAEALSVENISGEIARMTLRSEQAGKLVWRQGQGSKTDFNASFFLDDFGQTLQFFDYQKILETRSGRLDFDLHWPGPPQDFSLRDAEGSVMVKLGSGSFLEAPSGATGALRVVSILNLADIVRRLSLSHMFESGIPFDEVDGQVFLHSGTIEVARMDVKGGSSFQFSGVSDVAAQSLDGELVATLPVAKNLPWVAALAASLPIAAGVFVVSKVFNKQMNRLSSAVYDISGSWDDPQVKFDHFFDDTSPRSADAGEQPGRDVPAAGKGDAVVNEELPSVTSGLQDPNQVLLP